MFRSKSLNVTGVRPIIKTLVTFLCIAGCQASHVSAQTHPTARDQPNAPRRPPAGQSDISGYWLNNTATPLERPQAFADRAFFTDAEAREYERHYLKDRAPALERQVNDEPMEPGRVLPNKRTSLIVDPANGKVPALTPDAQQRAADRARHVRDHPADGPEDLPLPSRCLILGAGPPMMPVFQNNNVFIVQTETNVVILNEMMHDVRVIPLDSRPHLPVSIRQWKGDARGRWEGPTLVVETMNFTNRTPFQGSGEGLRVVERFRRIDANTLQYEFTIDDPASFTAPWSASSIMAKTNGPMYEYACHEGNYSLVNMLRGARSQERNR
jgi:hypothetical protein